MTDIDSGSERSATDGRRSVWFVSPRAPQPASVSVVANPMMSVNMDDLMQPPFVGERRPYAELRPFTVAMNHIETYTGHSNERGTCHG